MTGRPWNVQSAELRQRADHYEAHWLLEHADLIDTLAALVSDLVDDHDCQLDRHGYCDTHDWMTHDRPCPHARAKEIGL